MAEKTIQTEILRVHGARTDLRIWRNNTGMAWTGNNIFRTTSTTNVRLSKGDIVIRRAHPIKFGGEGQADILGIGSGGRFIAIEVKSPRGRQSAVQKRWAKMVTDFGGLYILARSPEDVTRTLNGVHNDN